MSSVPSRWVVTETDLSTAADVFPALPGQGFPKKAPSFNTVKREAASGRQIRRARWSSPRWLFEISYEVLRNRVSLPELSKLFGFFLTALGNYGAWFFLDPYENTVSNATLGTGDGSTTDFQATRTWGAGTGYAFNDPVYAFWLQPVVYVNGAPTTAFTVQPWGVIRFNYPPADGTALTWSGKYLFACAFADDSVNAEQMTKDLFSAGGIKFYSLKP